MPSCRNPRPALNVIGVAIVVGPSVAAGHHAASAFDLRAPALRMAGVVAEVEWANPHVYLYIDTLEGGSGRWAFEGVTTNATERQCWKRSSIAPGDTVVVAAGPPRNPDKRLGYLTRLDMGGRTLWSREGSPCADAPTAGRSDSVAGLWSLEPARLDSVDAAALPAADIPFYARHAVGELPLTPAGAAALEPYSDEAVAALACTPVTPPLSLVSGGPIEIEVRQNLVVIRTASFATTRTVQLNVDSHNGASESLLGHSIGHWEAGTLVVDTARFAEHPEGNLRFPPLRLRSSNQRRLLERFALADDGRALEYAFELTDPVYLAEPVRGAHRFVYAPEIDFALVPCSVANARRFLTDDTSSSNQPTP